MAASIPAKLKEAQISQFAARAAQLEKHKPIISYWLRFYMTQKIIGKNLHVGDEEATKYTVDLMDKLETMKAEYPTEDALLDEVAAYAYCEQFALQVFSKGDKEIRENKVTKATADTFLAASTFFETLTIWKNPLEPEVQAKLKYAKYHAARILKAIKAGTDPNESNPKQETPAVSPAPLDPNDPEVQRISDGISHLPTQPSHQPYVESAPNTSAQPSPALPAQGATSPPTLPSAPTGYSQPNQQPRFSSHDDVSPISQSIRSRQGSVASAGGGYFPRVDVPTFTADAAAPSLPTAPSLNEDQPMTSPFDNSLPQPPQPPSAPPLADPQQFYNADPSSPPVPQPPQQPSFQPPPNFTSTSQLSPQNPYQQQAQPPQIQPYQQQYAQAIPATTQASHQGPLRTDEESVAEAQKHAKWAISALNFEDVNTAVKELRTALKALGAN
ncbi:DUF605-domain-containing protein [Aaosphaeria arxii CBS 175.79]|uniref:DUF605-domain-containing protein n=1 Tax=Aaosphaeria arxii CBS 175.79 TaxID=1450172 RepID=A0A6A5XJN5_9PLEO|nr:DUF605-domain-containing protein [Aaosphaeria arxii CBS 175.79]KAF2013485.1 DUF605-domain-containing protein [Aaosphaeria arxii CBS 175.79]